MPAVTSVKSFLRPLSESCLFSGWLRRFSHSSLVCDCEMSFSIYLPPQASQGRVPVLYWLPGFACSDADFIRGSGAARIASELGMAIVVCDTSPRGDQVADSSSPTLGLGGGFYLNASREPWARHYKMYDYIVSELPQLINMNFPVNPLLTAIAGHSMGGHGALVAALRDPSRYKSVSAFSPILSPSHVGWGVQAFTEYLGDERQRWKSYDATELLTVTTAKLPMLIDQGGSDEHLLSQLTPAPFLKAAEKAAYPVEYRSQFGYDHSEYFVASFIEDHLRFHAKALGLRT
ncbi:S-formylglutathione hydrolase [Sinobacterium caligoides]|uniref:S-formylglutathione hydrolase n=1 Tax=Sinobacterium caligoides TaxID=933926 RepID=A0A3N2DMV7_9GAMM|nr:S-formylglutathione hydrolase [Sinobacterium caligoides]ROS00989.1 S-formylglutathione hydrolase [Sinobacterium caligoides]